MWHILTRRNMHVKTCSVAKILKMQKSIQPVRQSPPFFSFFFFLFFLKPKSCVVWMENMQKNNTMERLSKNSTARNIQSVSWHAIPGPPVHPGHPVSPLPPSHDFSDRIGFFRELFVMATLSKVLFGSQAKRGDVLATKDYLFTSFARWNRWRSEQRWHP